MTRLRTLAFLWAMMLTGCTLMPEYERPVAPVPAEWSGSTAPGGEVAAADTPWRSVITDPRLRQVVELALANNRDLRMAALNVERVQALYRIQRAERSPGVGVMATGEVYRLPGAMTESGSSETVERYSVQLGLMSWELDLFGRIRSLEASALEQYLATEQARVATHASLVAAVSGAYLMLAADVESLTLARETLDAYRTSAELIRLSRDAGVASDLDLAQAQSQVDGARAAAAAFRGRVAAGRNALDLLVGAPVPDELLPDALSAVDGLDDLDPGVPSEVLLRRPDILAAEHNLMAANARIGAARAAFFPRISLTAGAGTMSSDLSELFGSGSGTWTFAPQILAPIFAGGSLEAGLRVSEVDRELAVAEYEKAIQVAFAEVCDGLALRATLREQREAQEALVRDLEQTARLSEARYQAGVDSYLAVLVAERSLFAARQGVVTVRLAEQLNLVDLFKALGGGTEGPEVAGVPDGSAAVDPGSTSAAAPATRPG